MIRFYFNKLVRDKIVQNCLDDPKVLETEYRVLDDDTFYRELIRKVSEEAEEIPNIPGNTHALNELADLQAVVDALRVQLGFSAEQVSQAAKAKEASKGGFADRHYINYVELADDSQWVEELREQPDKYREVPGPKESA